MGKSKKLRKLIKAAKMGKPYAQYQLGIVYQLGREVARDMTVVAMWMSRAEKNGYLPAKEWLADYSFDDDANIQSFS